MIASLSVFGHLDLFVLRLDQLDLGRQIADHFDAIADRPEVLAALEVGEAELVGVVLGP